MKSKSLQNIVFTKYPEGDEPTKMSNDLAGKLSLENIKR